MKADVFNNKNEKIEEVELSERIFGARWNLNLVNQALSAQLANRRQPLAHAKGRGEVSGGGKKPWRQKGTGRARHGSIRSPLWIGGGVTFGPTKEKIFAKKINKKMNRLAIFSVLSKKAKDSELKILDSFSMPDISKNKTKEVVKNLKNIISQKASVLLIPASENKDINRLVSNIKNMGAISPKSLNIYDLLKYKNIILEKGAVGEIEKCYK